ncbi:hypothetical protein QYE76_070610 [Lolium multiflorum]|uniref:CCHC-type domain-containing protein n=1 Tax=Lolium multiflorum TaxID=4521 RepID=A0AAD8WEL1_LOLMU|nr:hypothetical protein QYE76_070610 [Lolium multiflorum]
MSSSDSESEAASVARTIACINMASSSTVGAPISLTNQITVRLTEDNYLFWRAQVLPILRSNGLMCHVGKDSAPPSEIANPQAGEAGAPARIPNPAYIAWYKQDQAILTAFLSSLTPEVFGIVVLANTAEEAWTTLASSLASQSTSRVMHLRNQLAETKKLDSPASVYFNRIKEISDTLTSIGHPLRQEELVSYLLAGLDEEYDAFVDRVSNRETPLPLRDVYAQLCNNEQRLEARKAQLRGDVHSAHLGHRGNGGPRSSRPDFFKPSPPPSMLPTPSFVRGDGGTGARGFDQTQSQDRPRPTCQLCGKLGHVASRCYKRFKKDFLGIGNDGRNNGDRQAAAATHGGHHAGNGGQNHGGHTPSYAIDPGWYADSGATDHLTSELDKLTLKERYGGKDKIQTANGSGIGRGARLEELPNSDAEADDHVDHHAASGDADVDRHADPASPAPPSPARGPGHDEHQAESPSPPHSSAQASPHQAVESPGPSASDSAPAPPPPALRGVVTRLCHGIRRPKTRTDGTVAWVVTCMPPADAASAEPVDHLRALLLPHWREAMQQEFDALQQNKTRRLVPRQPGMNVIDSKWVFKVKQRADGVYEMSSLKFDLPQLDYTTRFALWQVKMRAILAQSSDLDEAIDAFGEKAKDTWTDAEKRKDRKALSLIQLHLSNNILQEVLQEKTTAELWVKLEEICLSKDLTGRLHVKMKLFSHKLQEGGSVMNHLSSWKEIVSDLQSIEVKYEDEDLGLLLLCSLPNSFSNFRDTILLSRDKLTLAEVYDALQQKEKMKSMVQAESSSSKAEALEVRGRPEQRDNYYHNNRDKSKGDRGRSKSKGRDKFCRYCKKSSHNIDDCWKLQNKEKRNGTYQPKNNDGNGKAAVVTGKGEAAVVAGNDSSDGDCLAVLAACVSRDDEWILDTACSFHICCNKDWFSSYESVQSGDFVRVGNDNQCSIVGIGSVQIKTHDGMTRTLTGVKHIPSMARNLISLSTLDCDGYKYKGGNKLLKVSSGSPIIMIGDMNSAKLYVLRGSTLPGIAAAVSSDESSKTNLWHKRLGHMSELGMAELTKRELIDGCDFGKLEFCEHCIFDLRVFGCTAYAHVDNGKLEPRAVKCIFLGYGSGVKAYRLWNPETKKIVLSRNVVFNEAVMFNDSPSTDISDTIDSPDVSDDEQHRIGVQVEHAKENENVVPETNNDDNDVPPSPPFVQRQGRSIAADRPRRNIAPPTRLIQECDIVDYALSCAEQVEHDIEPATYTEAIASVDKEKWVGAMQEEMQSLEKNGTWDVVHLPKQKKAVRCKWIFKRKEGLSPNEPPRFKARLVAKGFSQIPGVDYNDVFSPVVKHSSIRAFFGIVAMHDLELEQLDVKTAFLHGELEEEIYMDQPEGYVVPGKEDLVCKLKRSLYGLKQSPRQWYKSCVYIKFVNGSPIYLLLYVDDMLIAAKSMKEITTLKNQLSSEFEMKDLGPAKKILGMEIKRDRKSSLLFLSQEKYIEKVLHRFNMHDANRYMANPGKEHWKAVQWIFRYLRGTSKACLRFGRIGEGLAGYVDSDYAGDLDKRRSLTGYVFTVGGCAVSWKATLQDVVAQSTTEAEYMAIAEADQMFHERTKHIDIKYHAIRDVVAKGKVKCPLDPHPARHSPSPTSPVLTLAPAPLLMPPPATPSRAVATASLADAVSRYRQGPRATSMGLAPPPRARASHGRHGLHSSELCHG